MPQTLTKTKLFEEYEAPVRKLIKQHRALKDFKLLLAIRFQPERDAGDVFLFEVIEGFAAGLVGSDKDIAEAAYESSPEFTMRDNHLLHLVVTHPKEFEIAVKENWTQIEEVRAAIKNGKSQFLYETPTRGKKMREQLSV